MTLTEIVWVPLAYPFQRAIQDATDRAFAGRHAIQTLFGETVLLDDVLGYSRKAEGPLSLAIQKLYAVDRADVVELVETFYPQLMPYWIGSGTKNPVHHTAYVVDHMATILIGEGRQATLKAGVLAALFHDVAQGLGHRKKITEQHIVDVIRQVVRGEAALDDLIRYRDDAVRARQEHMRAGARIAGERLEAHRDRHPGTLTDGEIAEVKRIVEHHDDPKIPVAYEVVRRTFAEDSACRAWRVALQGPARAKLDAFLGETGQAYLIRVGDWLLQVHHEADLLWMLTQDGIDADLARFSPAARKTPREMIDNNVGLHRQEVALYRGRPDFEAYGFRTGTAYRSETGYLLFETLTRILDRRVPCPT